MLKFYGKKETALEKSPILLQLERRHTVVEGDPELDRLKPISRSSSASSLDKSKYKSLESWKDESRNYSNASTLVVTESELSSSWLYKNKKEQMNSETISPCDLTKIPSLKEDMKKSPRLPRPNIKSENTNQKRPKKSSCCCYASIMLIICLSSVGILLAIGSILYMEFFAVINKAYNQTNDSSFTDKPEIQHFDDFYPMRKMGDLFDSHSDLDSTSSESLVTNSIAEISDGEINNQGSDRNENINSILDEQKNFLNELPSTTLTSIADEETNHRDETSLRKEFDIKDLTSLDTSSSDQVDDSPYSKLFELYKDLHHKDSENHLSDNSVKFENQLKSEFNSNFNMNKLDTESSINQIQDNEENLQLSESKFPKTGVNKSFELEITTPEEMLLNILESEHTKTQSGTNHLETLLPNVPSMFAHGLENGNVGMKNSFRMLGADFEKADHNIDDENLKTSELSEELDWNRPVLETNIAIPGPIEVIRRLNNRQSHVDFSDQDRQFSLAKALERLRLLDTANILPSSRRKLNPVKTPPPKHHSKQNVRTERSMYLQNLRKRLFDNSVES